MWHCRTWFGRHGGVKLTVGLDDLRSLFQLNDSMLQYYPLPDNTKVNDKTKKKKKKISECKTRVHFSRTAVDLIVGSLWLTSKMMESNNKHKAVMSNIPFFLQITFI